MNKVLSPKQTILLKGLFGSFTNNVLTQIATGMANDCSVTGNVSRSHDTIISESNIKKFAYRLGLRKKHAV